VRRSADTSKAESTDYFRAWAGSLPIIEDDDLLRDVIATALTQSGHTVVQANEGRKGCDLFRASPCDLVLTDLIMPGQEGIETIMRLRHDYPGLPMIAMSGGSTHAKSYLGIAAKLGVRRALSKPFTLADLNRAIGEALAADPPPPSPLAA